MPRPTGGNEPAAAYDLRSLWIDHLDRHANDQRWGLMLLALAALHLVAMVACQLAHLEVGATQKWVYPAIWVAEVYLTFRIARAFAGRGWPWRSPMTSVVFRVWVTYLILCFSVASLNTLSGFEHDWFKPVWCTLGTFGFATMAWIVSLWFLVPAVQMYFTGLLMVAYPNQCFLIHGVSFGVALTGIGVALEWRRRKALAAEPAEAGDLAPGLPGGRGEVRIPGAIQARDHAASIAVRIGAVVAALGVGLGTENRSRADDAARPRPDLGPNVLVFRPDMPMAEIQKTLDNVFASQEHAQFGTERYAYLFLPGTYELDVNLGFYTQAIGLGRSPDDVTIRGSVHSEADWMGGNATCTFWRAAENLSVTPVTEAPINFAVSQGTSFRRMHVRGEVNLWDGGWSSGGFLADSRIEGRVNSGSQQQWLSRNCEWGG